MPETSEYTELPPASSLRKLRDTTIALAKRLDPFLTYLEDTQGYATMTIEIRRGIPVDLKILRSFKLDDVL